MSLQLTSFVKQLTLFAILLFGVYGILILLLPSRFITDAWWALVPFFYLVVLISRYFLVRTSSRRKSFDTTYITTTVIRFMLYVSILLLYSFRNPEDAVAFIITFFVFYFVFTLFELSRMYREIKSGNK